MDAKLSPWVIGMRRCISHVDSVGSFSDGPSKNTSFGLLSKPKTGIALPPVKKNSPGLCKKKVYKLHSSSPVLECWHTGPHVKEIHKMDVGLSLQRLQPLIRGVAYVQQGKNQLCQKARENHSCEVILLWVNNYLDLSSVECGVGKASEVVGESWCSLQLHPSEALPKTGPWQP